MSQSPRVIHKISRAGNHIWKLSTVAPGIKPRYAGGAREETKQSKIKLRFARFLVRFFVLYTAFIFDCGTFGGFCLTRFGLQQLFIYLKCPFYISFETRYL